MTTLYWPDWVGYIGVLLILLAYLLLQLGKLLGNGLLYQLMNVFGAIGVILSLSFGLGPVNWPAFLMELAWIIIGVFGIVRGVALRREARGQGGRANPSPPQPSP
jgi:paired small multidrug resistance pump